MFCISNSPYLVLSASVSLSDVNILPNLKNVSWLQTASELSMCGKILTRLPSFSLPISITLPMMKELSVVNINAKQYKLN